MRSRGSGWLGKDAVETSPSHRSTWSDQRSRVRMSLFTISAPFDQAGGAMVQFGRERRVDLCGQLPRAPQVFLGLRTKTSSRRRMERLACSLPTGVCPRKVSNLSDRIHHNPLSLDHPTMGSGGWAGWSGWGGARGLLVQSAPPRGVTWGGAVLVQSAPPPLAPNKHVAGDSLGRARESRSPAPSPVPQLRAGGSFLGARRLHRNLAQQD